VLPFLRSRECFGERPTLPMIDLALSKENASPSAPFTVGDGRKAEVTNSVFGAVCGVVNGTPYPICDTAGYAPFSFGYRRCAGEQLMVEFVKELLRTVWRNGIEFVRLDIEHPEPIPVSPRIVIEDNIVFSKGA
jgi:hypothetical protein